MKTSQKFLIFAFISLSAISQAYSEPLICKDVFNSKVDYINTLGNLADPNSAFELKADIGRLPFEAPPAELKESINSLFSDLKRALSIMPTGKWLKAINASRERIGNSVGMALFSEALSEADLQKMIEKNFPRAKHDPDNSDVALPSYIQSIQEIYSLAVKSATGHRTFWGSYKNYFEVKNFPELENQELIAKIVGADNENVRSVAAKLFLKKISEQQDSEAAKISLANALSELVSNSNSMSENDFTILMNTIKSDLAKLVGQHINRFSFNDSDIDDLHRTVITQVEEENAQSYVGESLRDVLTKGTQISKTQVVADAVVDGTVRIFRTVRRDVQTAAKFFWARFKGEYHDGNSKLKSSTSFSSGVIIKGHMGTHTVYIQKYSNSAIKYIKGSVDGHEFSWRTYGNGGHMAKIGYLPPIVIEAIHLSGHFV